MKRRLLFTGFLMVGALASQNGFSQDAELIRIDSMYHECGVIFTERYELSVGVRDMRNRFTPTIDDVIQAERLFLKNYNLANQANEVSKAAKYIADPKGFFNLYIRQYAGYYDLNGNKVILIHLIDNSKPNRVKKEIGDQWKRVFVLILAQPMPFNVLTYEANLQEGKLSIF